VLNSERAIQARASGNRKKQKMNRIRKIIFILLLFCLVSLCKADVKISIDPNTHINYGANYPITYKTSCLLCVSSISVYKKYLSAEGWQQLPSKTANDFFNGIDAVRFDSVNGIAYISVAFSPESNDIYLKLLDSNGNDVFCNIYPCNYYDNRRAVVTATSDDWCPLYDPNFRSACDAFTSRQLWLAVGIVTQQYPGSSPMDANTWASIQQKVNAGYIEPASHSRDHNETLLATSYISEIGGSALDIEANLVLPSWMMVGGSPRVYTYIAPGGYYDNNSFLACQNYGFLLLRGSGGYNNNMNIPGDGWSKVITDNVYLTDWYVRMGTDTAGITDANTLNSYFNSTYNAGGIYHLQFHPYNVDWTTGSYAQIHLNYIQGRNDVWYVPFGLLYLYHYLLDQSKISIEPNCPEPNGSVSSANMKLSAADGVAFVDFNSVGTLTNYIGYQIVITDSNGHVIYGWIKSAGTGETYGNNLLANPTFNTGINHWWPMNLATLADVNGGVNGTNCLQVTGSGAFSDNFATTLGALMLYGAFVNAGTSTQNPFSICMTTSPLVSGIASSSWTFYSGYYTETNSQESLFLMNGEHASGTISFNEAIANQVLTPSVTGVTIVSSKDGSTYNWTWKDPNFYYADTNYSYRFIGAERMNLLAIFASNWLQICSPPDWCGGMDSDQSGKVDFVDFATLAQNW
jgi:hypothetical protein